MDIMEAMRQRHAVRAYLNRPMEGETLKALEDCIAECRVPCSTEEDHG